MRRLSPLLSPRHPLLRNKLLFALVSEQRVAQLEAVPHYAMRRPSPQCSARTFPSRCADHNPSREYPSLRNRRLFAPASEQRVARLEAVQHCSRPVPPSPQCSARTFPLRCADHNHSRQYPLLRNRLLFAPVSEQRVARLEAVPHYAMPRPSPRCSARTFPSQCADHSPSREYPSLRNRQLSAPASEQRVARLEAVPHYAMRRPSPQCSARMFPSRCADHSPSREYPSLRNRQLSAPASE